MNKTIELFCGTKSFSKVAKQRGHETFTIDNNKEHNPDIIRDISKISEHDLEFLIIDSDIIWMSPPCQTLSIASGNTHWTIDRKPKTNNAIQTIELINICKVIMNYCIKHNKIFFIENPRARMRWFLPKEYRHTVWYCQYGDTRAKPTDIWTNLKGWKGKECKNNNPNCHHERAPRGSKTGTQGLKGRINRGVIPPQLFEELFNIMEEQNESLHKKKNSK